MYKRTANAATFIGRSGNHSTKGSRRGYDTLDQGQSVASAITPYEERESLKRQNAALEARRKLLPECEERAELGRQMQRNNLRISELRPKCKAPQGTGQHFIEVCRERMSKAQFDAWMSEAVRRAGGKPYSPEEMK